MKADRLSIRWLDTFYFKGDDVLQRQTTTNSSWILKKIVKHKEALSTSKHWLEAATTGHYKIGAVYKDLNGDMEHVSWKKILVDNHAEPQTGFTLWMALMKQLPTKERLLRFGINVDLKCCYCDNSGNIQHFFFGCSYIKDIWKQILRKLKVKHQPLAWDQEVEWITKETKPKEAQRMILKLAFAETVYEIWHERNDRVFKI
ncbi:uncharacterized protein LOC131654706 [Vicia villosa]|uniref:uncharacterized protein LOC131654706 n=1 Tax=Vicia villosa TaxID=3911 RepID=UPI00273B9E98|nr:uncharacterized protein LOC131654706 [Vicia villosa]